MKKSLVMTLLVLALTVGLVFESFGQQPQSGGVLRIVNPTGPAVIGYFKEMGPADLTGAFPAIEALMDYTSRREIKPFLAESVDINEKI